MRNDKDVAFIDFLIQQTQNRQLHWEATALPAQYTVSFKGKYNVTVDKSVLENVPKYWLKLKDDQDREMLKLGSWEYDEVETLFQLAARDALNVDVALDEIMAPEPIRDEDIPF